MTQEHQPSDSQTKLRPKLILSITLGIIGLVVLAYGLYFTVMVFFTDDLSVYAGMIYAAVFDIIGLTLLINAYRGMKKANKNNLEKDHNK